MDSAQVGLDYIVESSDYIEKLASALDSKIYVVKKQVFELLSALSVYSNEGYIRTLQTLEYFKKQTGERYRFKFIICELQNAQSVEYQTAVLAFINCLILATPELQERVRVRSEFIGLRLLNVLSDLRHQNKQCPDLIVQLDVFDEQKESDDSSHLSPTFHGLDLSSPLEVFDMIIRQISDTPHEIPFLCILQHLLRIDAKESISDLIWDTAERLVHRATLLESSEDSLRLLNTPSHHPSKSLLKAKENSPPPPPKAPPPPPSAPPPAPPSAPPPPPPLNGMPLAPGAIPGPPILPGLGNKKPTTLTEHIPKLPQQSTPIPKTKMKTINWSKIPSGLILDGNQNNMWATLAKSHLRSKLDLDWGALERLFCIQQEKPTNLTPVASPSGPSKNDEFERRNSKRDEVILLDAKRSLNINIFIKQFRSSNDDMIQLIINGCSEDFGAERLRGLLKILPSEDEISLLQSVSSDDKIRLGTAENFLLQLIKVNGYRLRIEAMLLKEELESCVHSIELSIKSVLQAARDVKTSQELQEVIFMILIAGNFLNSGGYAGDAAGVKLSSLQKIAEIRGNNPGIYLLHFIAMQAETRNLRLISFVDDMLTLKEASKTSVDQLNTEISALKSKVTTISKQMGNPNVPRDILSQFRKFFKEADLQIDSLKVSLPKVEEARIDLAHFFCEDLQTFKLEDCFKILFTFTTRWKSAAAENRQRKIHDKEMELRRKAREEQVKKRCQIGWQNQFSAEAVLLNHDRNKGTALTPDDEIFIACSPRVVRRRLAGPVVDNNGTTNAQTNNDNLTLPSPETTPNGSFRRRRSRAPSDEDEAGLMDFLHVSGEESSTEKRPPNEQYGSLDRSWSRKTRRRPNLLDFVNDERERTVSPASGQKDFKTSANSPTVHIERPNAETKHENPAKEWRERIAAWFVDLENCGSGEIPKRQPPPKKFQRRLGQESRVDVPSRNLATLPEGDVGQEEDNMALRAYQRVYPDRKPSLKLNTDVLSAMEAIEEVQSPVKEKSLWRRPSLITNEVENQTIITKDESPAKKLGEDSRRSLIESLGNQTSEDDKLVLYMARPQNNIVNTRLTSDGTAKDVKTKSTSFENKEVELHSGTKDGFDRFASIRRSRRIKRPEMSTPQLPRRNTSENNSHAKFVSKVDITSDQGPLSHSDNKDLNLDLHKTRQRSDPRSISMIEPGQVHMALNGSTVKNEREEKTEQKIGHVTHKSPIIFSIGQRVNNKPKTSNGTTEYDEGFEELQSSLSETNSQTDPNALNNGGFNKIARSPLKLSHSLREPSKSIQSIKGFGSAISPALKRKTLQEISPAHLTVNNGNNNNNNSSRSSLLSSKSSLTSQTTVNTVRDKNDSNSKTKNSLNSPTDVISNSNQKRFFSSSFKSNNGNTPRNMQNGKTAKNESINIDQNNCNTDQNVQPQGNSVEKVKSSSKGLAPRFLSFMRPTASSSAKDKLDPPKSKGGSFKRSFK